MAGRAADRVERKANCLEQPEPRPRRRPAASLGPATGNVQRADVVPASASRSDSTTAGKGTSASSSARPYRTPTPSAPSSAANSRHEPGLADPGSPLTKTSRRPFRAASAHAACSLAISRSRPTSGPPRRAAVTRAGVGRGAATTAGPLSSAASERLGGRGRHAELTPQTFGKPLIGGEPARAVAAVREQPHQVAVGGLVEWIERCAAASQPDRAVRGHPARRRLRPACRAHRRRARGARRVRPAPSRRRARRAARRGAASSASSQAFVGKQPIELDAHRPPRPRPARCRARVAIRASAPTTARSADRAVRRLVRALSSSTFGPQPPGDRRAGVEAGIEREPAEQGPRRPPAG